MANQITITPSIDPVFDNPADAKRFEDYIEITEDCWYWSGPFIVRKARLSKPTPVFARKGRARESALKLSYRYFIGPLPENTSLVLRKCKTTECVSPLHLAPMTGGHCSFGHIKVSGACRVCEQERLKDRARNWNKIALTYWNG